MHLKKKKKLFVKPREGLGLGVWQTVNKVSVFELTRNNNNDDI